LIGGFAMFALPAYRYFAHATSSEEPALAAGSDSRLMQAKEVAFEND